MVGVCVRACVHGHIGEGGCWGGNEAWQSGCLTMCEVSDRNGNDKPAHLVTPNVMSPSRLSDFSNTCPACVDTEGNAP